MKNIFYTIALTVFVASCSSGPHYTVKGKLAGADSVKIFYLQKRDAGKMVRIDSAICKKGLFTFKGGKVDFPQLVQLVAGNSNKRTAFYLENSDITISGNVDSLYNAKFTGSKTQEEYNSFIELNKPLSDDYNKTYTEYQAASQAGNAAKVAELEKKADSIQNAMTSLQKNFVKEHPSSYTSPSILVSLSYDMDPDEISSAVSAMDTAIARLPQIKSLMERVVVMKSVAVGKKAPDFTLSDPDDKPVSLYSKLGSKLLLVDFWASWCGPCRHENPNVVKVYSEFNKKGFNIFSVSLDKKKEDWVKAIADDKLTWTHVSDLQYWSSAAAKLYAVNSIPANFLLDETGTIIGKNLRGDDLYKKVKELLEAKK